MIPHMPDAIDDKLKGQRREIEDAIDARHIKQMNFVIATIVSEIDKLNQKGIFPSPSKNNQRLDDLHLIRYRDPATNHETRWAKFRNQHNQKCVDGLAKLLHDITAIAYRQDAIIKVEGKSLMNSNGLHEKGHTTGNWSQIVHLANDYSHDNNHPQAKQVKKAVDEAMLFPHAQVKTTTATNEQPLQVIPESPKLR